MRESSASQPSATLNSVQNVKAKPILPVLLPVEGYIIPDGAFSLADVSELNSFVTDDCWTVSRSNKSVLGLSSTPKVGRVHCYSLNDAVTGPHPTQEPEELSSDEEVFLPTTSVKCCYCSCSRDSECESTPHTCALCNAVPGYNNPNAMDDHSVHKIKAGSSRYGFCADAITGNLQNNHQLSNVSLPADQIISQKQAGGLSFNHQSLKYITLALCSSPELLPSTVLSCTRRMSLSLGDLYCLNPQKGVSQKVRTIFHRLFLPPMLNFYPLSQLLQTLSPSTKLLSGCRLPWHAATNRRTSNRIIQNLYRSHPKGFSGRKQTQSTVDVDKPQLISTSHKLGIDMSSKSPVHVKVESNGLSRRTYATVAASSAKRVGDSWLTPAEASALKSSVDDKSTCRSTPNVSHTSSMDSKISSASVKATRDYIRTVSTPVHLTADGSAHVGGFEFSFDYYSTHRNVYSSNRSSGIHGPAHPDPFSAIPPCHFSGYINNQLPAFEHCQTHQQPPHALSTVNRNPSVFVDLTGYDVTVSVERLPPVNEATDRHRNNHRKRSPPNTDSVSTPSDPSSPLPLSPPPPYSKFSSSSPYSANPSRCSHAGCAHLCPGMKTSDWRLNQGYHNIPIARLCPFLIDSADGSFIHTGFASCGCLVESCACMRLAHSICARSNQFVRQHSDPTYSNYGFCPACGFSPLATDPSTGGHSPSGQVLSASNNYVYIPEPIRVSRSQDVYNALRTCLVPHYELREYFTSAPPQRQWRKLGELSKDGFPFTLMCYNLLSPNYATANMYPYCPSWALSWDYRRRFILDEIRMYHANIICLQEVETDQFEEIFKPELKKLKYDAVFLPKSRRRTMDMKECKKVDGCAIFWQVDKFEKVHEFHHEFMFSCSNICDHPAPVLVNRVMTRDNVALGVIFETKGPSGPDGPGGRQFCVTTGHIHWDPEHSDVKMIQTILWTAELWAYIDQYLTDSGSSTGGRLSPANSRLTPLSNKISLPGPSSPAANMPVILCGDLNSLPDSGVVEFLMRGSLPKSHTDFLDYGFKYMFEDWRLLEKWAVDGDTLRHRFTFDRAYRENQGMRMTNFTYEFKGMIDYVLYSRQHFRLLGSLDQIHESWFSERKIVGCPHVHFPSDHFALLVELELKPTSQLNSFIARRDKLARGPESLMPTTETTESVAADAQTVETNDPVGPDDDDDAINVNGVAAAKSRNR